MSEAVKIRTVCGNEVEPRSMHVVRDQSQQPVCMVVRDPDGRMYGVSDEDWQEYAARLRTSRNRD